MTENVSAASTAAEPKRETWGGKGLNVSRVLCQLGDDVVATGLLGGHIRCRPALLSARQYNLSGRDILQ